MGHFATKRQQSFVFSCLCSSFAEKRRIMEKEKLEMFATLEAYRQSTRLYLKDKYGIDL